MRDPEIRVHGSGIISRALALAFARQGLAVRIDARLVNRPNGEAGDDVRAYALNAASVELLRALRVWEALAPDARTVVHDMRVAGDGGGAITFSAWQQAVPALAWIVDAAELERVLETAIRFVPALRFAEGGGEEAALTVFAQGRDAMNGERPGLIFKRHAYGHSALAARVIADRGHAGVARQWFRCPEVLALLPFDRPTPTQSYGLVWAMPSADAERLVAAQTPVFEAALNEATHGEVGRLSLGSRCVSWPLIQVSVNKICGPGWALVGDAAHVIHPLAGQGLNLGLADVAALVKVVVERESWRSLGDEVLLRRYARARLWPTRRMSAAVDGLWQLFSTSNPGLRELRNQGMSLVNQVSPLKRWLIARALGA